MVVMSKADRERMYTEFLRVEGYRPDLDQDGKVRFHRRGVRYTLTIDEMEEYFDVGVPCWSIKSEAERLRARKAALHANEVTKVARIRVLENIVRAAVGMFVSPPEGFKAVFGRVMSAVAYALEVFLGEMRTNPAGTEHHQ